MWSSIFHKFSPSPTNESHIASQLQKSEFIPQLRKFKDLWKIAFDGSHHLVVPPNSSLDVKMTRDQIESHILTDTRIVGRYRTLNNRIIEMKGEEFEGRRGFEKEVKVKILSVERINCDRDLPTLQMQNRNKRRTSGKSSFLGSTFSSPGNIPLKPHIISEEEEEEDEREDESVETHLSTTIYHVSHPLDGGVTTNDEEAEGGEMGSDTVRRMVGLLRSFPQTESIFSSLDSFVEGLGKLIDEEVENGQHQPSTHHSSHTNDSAFFKSQGEEDGSPGTPIIIESEENESEKATDEKHDEEEVISHSRFTFEAIPQLIKKKVNCLNICCLFVCLVLVGEDSLIHLLLP